MKKIGNINFKTWGAKYTQAPQIALINNRFYHSKFYNMYHKGPHTLGLPFV